MNNKHFFGGEREEEKILVHIKRAIKISKKNSINIIFIG